MRRIDCEQGSPEWIKARLGRPTASQFHRIVTPAKMDYSKAASTYVAELLAESIIGKPVHEVSTAAMVRGTDLESDAVKWYEFFRDIEVERVGFCLHDDFNAGASPDGLVGDDGGLEIKCPEPHTHIKNLLGDEVAKPTQVHGNLWVTGRKWWDVVSYHPDLPPVLYRVERDDKWIDALDVAMNTFLTDLDTMRRQLNALGPSGRIDGADLEAQLQASIDELYGVEPNPDELDIDGIGRAVHEMEQAHRSGVVSAEDLEQFRALAEHGQWGLMKSALEDVRKAMKAVA